ncbi:sulfatase-like hydrolase/transferase [Rhizobacter sp. P5_C2]
MHRHTIARLLAAARKRTEAIAQSHRLSTQLAVIAVLLVACGGFFLTPDSWRFVATPFALSAASALVAYIGRRRLADAVVLALPPLAGRWVDPEVGSHALLVACLVIYLLTQRPRFAAVAGSTVAALLLAAIRLKQQFAGTPLTWQDVRFFFRQFADNVGVLGTQPTLVWYAGAALSLAILGCIAAWRWNPPGRQPGWSAASMAAALAALLVTYSGVLVAKEVSNLKAAGMWFVGAGLVERPALGFFATASLDPRWGVEAADTTAFRHESLKLVSAEAKTTPADIVVFLQESQFNPATLAGCPATLCGLDAFAATGSTIAHGPLQVHVFGGSTWLSEFAFATGVPHDSFGPAGEFAPFSVAPHVHRSFVRSLKAAGYRTVALYPTRGGMMNGRIAYAGYGFDEFLDAAELGLPEAWGTPDALVHEAARRVLARERQRDQPVFLFALTIFNHAEHGVEMERVPAELRAEASRDFASADEARSVADYVWRSREFERELKRTREAVLGNAQRPAVLAWFGDHQPPFANAITLRDRIRSLPTQTGTVPAKYQTWYEVSSNRPDRAPTEAPSALDLVFLPGLLAQAAGAPIDDWLAANISARTQCAGLLEACRTPGVREAYLSYLWDDLKEFALP